MSVHIERLGHLWVVLYQYITSAGFAAHSMYRLVQGGSVQDNQHFKYKATAILLCVDAHILQARQNPAYENYKKKNTMKKNYLMKLVVMKVYLLWLILMCGSPSTPSYVRSGWALP